MDGGGVSIGANRANSNGNLGIQAAPGNTDAGVNHAQDKGNPAQCVGISCTLELTCPKTP